MRLFVKILLFPFLTIFLTLLTIFTAIFTSINSEDLYLNNLEEASIYTDLPTIIAETISVEVEKNFEEEVSRELGSRNNTNVNIEISGVYENFKPLITDTLVNVLDPIVFQTTVENNIVSWFDYLNNRADILNVYIPKEYFKEVLEEQVLVISDQLRTTIETTRTCNLDEQRNIDQNILFGRSISIDCIPTNIKESFLEQNRLDVLNSIEKVVETLENENKFIGGEEVVSLEEFLDSLSQNPQDTSKTESLSKNLETFKKIFLVVNDVLIGLWAFLILSILLFGLLTKGNLGKKISSTWPILLTSGLIVFGFGNLLRTIISERIVSELEISITSSSQGESTTLLMEKLFLLIQLLLADLSRPLMISGFILIALGAFFFICRIFLLTKGRKVKKVKDKHEHTSIKQVLDK